MKKINENTKVTLTIGQLKRLVKESTVDYEKAVAESIASGPTCEESLDQIALDAKKAKEAYLNGENSEASDIVFKIINDARKVSNRLTETTGGPLVENSQGLVDQVLEDPQVQSRAEQFINALIEYAVEYDEYDYPAGDNVTRSDEMRWEDLVKAIKSVVARYKGAK